MISAPQHRSCSSNCPCALQLVCQLRFCSLLHVLKRMPNPLCLLQGSYHCSEQATCRSRWETQCCMTPPWTGVFSSDPWACWHEHKALTCPSPSRKAKIISEVLAWTRLLPKQTRKIRTPSLFIQGFPQQRYTCVGVWHAVQAQSKGAT